MTTPHALRALPTALLVALTVIANACSAETTTGEDPSSPDAAMTAEASPTDDGSTDPAGDPWHSPIGDFMAQDEQGGEADPAAIARQNQAFGEALAVCMAEQGFDYQHRSADASDTPDGRGPFELSEEEFATEYGYGITTIDEDDRQGWQDPNEAMLEEMSVAERTAWNRARYGETMQLDDNGEVTGMPAPVSRDDAIDRGCEGQAADEVWGGDEGIDHAAVEEQFATLFADMATIWERVDDDPRVVAAVDEWSACMADGGHPGLDATQDAYAAVRQRLLEVTGTGDLAGTADASGRDMARAAALDALAAADPAEVQAMRDFEVAMAVADHQCQASAHLDEVRQTVQTEVEIAFIDEHRDELEAYRAAVSGDEAEGRG